MLTLTPSGQTNGND